MKTPKENNYRVISDKFEIASHGWRFEYRIEASDATFPGVRGIGCLKQDGQTRVMVERLYALLNGPSIRRDLRDLLLAGVEVPIGQGN